jgi:spore coat polysaccharide biosynthesis predicted glycosyltransferase SpsG
LIYQPKTDHLKDILAETDIAICAGGQTLCELACMGVPSLVVGIIDNQLNNIEGWRKVGFIANSGWWQNENVMSILQESFVRLQDEEIRRQRSMVGQRFVDGKGSLRVGDFLLGNHRKN